MHESKSLKGLTLPHEDTFHAFERKHVNIISRKSRNSLTEYQKEIVAEWLKMVDDRSALIPIRAGSVFHKVGNTFLYGS